MKRTIYHSIILDTPQVDYLMGGTAGINRMECLYRLIRIIIRQIEDTANVAESPSVLWQLNLSEVSLSKLWKCDRKTVSKMLDRMAELGILSSVQTKRGSVHTLRCVSAWVVDGRKFANPNYIPINQREVKTDASVLHSPCEETAHSASARNADEEHCKIVEIPNKGEDTSYNSGAVGKVDVPLPSSLCSETHPNRGNENEPYPLPSAEDMAMEEEARLHFNEEQSCQSYKDIANAQDCLNGQQTHLSAPPQTASCQGEVGASGDASSPCSQTL